MKTNVKKYSNLNIALGDLFILPALPKDGPKEAPSKKDAKKATAFSNVTPASLETLRGIDRMIGNLLSQQVAHFEYRAGKQKRLTVTLPHRGKYVRISGVSAEALKDTAQAHDEWRKLGGDAQQQAASLRVKHIVILLDAIPESHRLSCAGAIIEGALLAEYEFTHYKSAKKKPAAGITLTLAGENLKTSELEKLSKRVAAVVSAVNFTRDLVNTAPNDMTPRALVNAARKVAKGRRTSLRVLNESQLKRLKAGALLAVAKGSDHEPHLIHATLKPRKKSPKQKTIVLVGKGVTFDSGGLSIKSAKGMEEMKCDMAGAACVLGVLRAMRELDAIKPFRHALHIIIPTVENMINGRSVRPGDIETAMNGKTIEILNTDAEGRLILADALAYSDRLKPDLIVDVATLTGACVVALGSDYAGLFTKNKELQKQLEHASARTSELVWPLPLAEEYRPLMDSPSADLKNTGDGGPGATMGALFLREFVPKGAEWAHLDIAGPAFWGKSNEYTKRGGTGFGVRLLVEFLYSLE